MSNRISGIGNAQNRINEITPEDVAAIRQYIIGWESGVISGFDCVNNDGHSITITAGEMFAYGYIGYLSEPITINFLPRSAVQYNFIYAEIDRSVVPNAFNIKIKNNQGGKDVKPTTFRQDNLTSVKTGIYQLPLYRVKVTVEGIEVLDIRDIKESIKKVGFADKTTQKITEELEHGSFQNNYYPTCKATTQDYRDHSNKIATTLFTYKAIRHYIDDNGDAQLFTMTLNFVSSVATFSKNSITLSADNLSDTITAYLPNNYYISGFSTVQGVQIENVGNVITATLQTILTVNRTRNVTVRVARTYDNFNIVNISYYGAGMTWLEWCQSAYNTDNYVCASETGFVGKNNIYISTDGTRAGRVKGQDIIESATIYQIYSSGGEPV